MGAHKKYTNAKSRIELESEKKSIDIKRAKRCFKSQLKTLILPYKIRTRTVGTQSKQNTK